MPHRIWIRPGCRLRSTRRAANRSTLWRPRISLQPCRRTKQRPKMRLAAATPTRCARECRKAKRRLRRATTAAAAARQLLGSVIKAREDALTAEAPKFASQAWQKAAERFRDAMAENEKNDTKNAQRRAAEAEVLLREAELIAIKGGILDEARTLIAQADEAKVGKLAPRSLQAAKRYLAEAEQEIQRNRYDVSSAAQARRASSLRSAARDLSRAAHRARVEGRGRRPGGHRGADPVVGRAAEADCRRRWSCRRSSTRACRRRCRRSTSTPGSRHRKCAVSSRSWPIARIN